MKRAQVDASPSSVAPNAALRMMRRRMWPRSGARRSSACATLASISSNSSQGVCSGSPARSMQDAKGGASVQGRDIGPAAANVRRRARLIIRFAIGDKAGPTTFDDPIARVFRAHRGEVLGLFVQLQAKAFQLALDRDREDAEDRRVTARQ